MKSNSILALLGFLPAVVFASLLSVPAVTTSTAITTAALPALSSFFLNRSRAGSEHTGKEIQATRMTGTSEENTPIITAAPTVEEIQLQEKYHLTTYWSCVTLHTYVHCGWHEPLLPGGTEIAGAPCGPCGARKVAMVAAGVVMAAGAVL
ncbi:hypothetical protein EYC80_008365 [Monilinia laxa]|uniref:Uncharacterized protein n=1 Tax=Monilinia laxa TaxID=61186 RepID=A0A5N6JRH3_MONLA|nr:hypothetical protein EYC80_008365 [Monilinia laxa]